MGEKHTWVGRRKSFVLCKNIDEKYLKEEYNTCPIIRLGHMNLPFCRSKDKLLDFPGGPMVKTLHFQCRGTGLTPSWRTKIPYAACHRQKKKDKLSVMLCNKILIS